MEGPAGYARSKPALTWLHAMTGLAGAALSLLSLSMALPWFSYSGAGSSVSFWVIGLYSVTSFTISGFSVWLLSDIFVQSFGTFLAGLYAGLGLFAVAHTTAILAAVYSARALRLLRGGRRLCCDACACACCCLCCCAAPPVGDAARLARARGSLRAALWLSGVVAACSAAAAAAVSIGSSSLFGPSIAGLITTSSIGVGLSAAACVLALAALATGCAAQLVLTEEDVKNAAGPLGVFPGGGTTVVMSTVQMTSPLQLPPGVAYAVPQGYVVAAATAPPTAVPVAYAVHA